MKDKLKAFAAGLAIGYLVVSFLVQGNQRIAKLVLDSALMVTEFGIAYLNYSEGESFFEATFLGVFWLFMIIHVV